MLANLVHLAKQLAYETDRFAMQSARLLAHLSTAVLRVGVGTVVLLFVRKLSTVPRPPPCILRHPLVRDLVWCVRTFLGSFGLLFALFGYFWLSRTHDIRKFLRD